MIINDPTVYLVLVAALWGATNVLIKKTSKDIVKIKSDSSIKQFLLEIKYLFTNIPYLLSMAVNQCGSLLYFLTLQTSDISLTVPVANSLTFVFTALSGAVLGENLPTKRSIIGIICIIIGTVLCRLSKAEATNK